jgi:hypothetical protein
VSSDRPDLSHMACAEKLSAALRPVPDNNAEARAESIFRLLAVRPVKVLITYVQRFPGNKSTVSKGFLSEQQGSASFVEGVLSH